jgi:hypothetical protein
MRHDDEGYRVGKLPGINGCSTGNEKEVDLVSDQLRSESWESFGLPLRVSRLDDDGFALHISQFSQRCPKGVKPAPSVFSRALSQIPDYPWNLPRRLRFDEGGRGEKAKN